MVFIPSLNAASIQARQTVWNWVQIRAETMPEWSENSEGERPLLRKRRNAAERLIMAFLIIGNPAAFCWFCEGSGTDASCSHHGFAKETLGKALIIGGGILKKRCSTSCCILLSLRQLILRNAADLDVVAVFHLCLLKLIASQKQRILFFV